MAGWPTRWNASAAPRPSSPTTASRPATRARPRPPSPPRARRCARSPPRPPRGGGGRAPAGGGAPPLWGPAPPQPPDDPELLLALGDARLRAGEPAREAFAAAAAIARDHGAAELLARAALGFSGL